MKFNVCFPLLYYIWIIILHQASCYNQLINTNQTKVKSSSRLPYGYGKAYKANLSIDGYRNQDVFYCMHTDRKRSQAWLHIDLGAIFNLKSVKIWYRGDIFRENRPSTFRLNGFSILASRMPEIDKKDTCYQDAGNVSLDTVIEINCTSVAQYVTIYNDKKNDPNGVMLEICEVEIYGCPRFKYGEKCASCDMCRNDCDITGQCDEYGCREGYLPPFCKAINQSLECKATTVHVSLYVVVAALFTSVLLNIIFVVRNARKQILNKANEEGNATRDAKEYILDRIEDTDQELGQFKYSILE